MQKINKRTSSLIKWVILIILVFTVICIPVGEEFTLQIKEFLVITVACIGMFAMGLFPSPLIPSLLLMFLYTRVSDMPTIMSGWTKDAPWCVICVLTILTVMHRTPLLKRVSYRSILLTGAAYSGICIAIYLVGMLLSFLGDSTCCALIGLAAAIVVSIGLEDKRAAAGIMLCAYFGITDAGYFILDPSGLPFWYGLASTASETIPSIVSHGFWFKSNIIYVPYYFMLLTLIIVFFKPKNGLHSGGKEFFRAELSKLGPISKEEKKLSVIIVLLFIYLLTSKLHGLSITYGFVGAVVLLFAPLIGIGTATDIKNVNFSFPVFVVACLAIGNVATSIGVGDLLIAKLMPILHTTKPIWFFFGIVIICFLLNFIMTPAAIYSCLMVPLATITVGLPFYNDILPLIVSILIGVQAMLLPYESANTLILYSFDTIELKDYVRGFFIKVILGFAWYFVAFAYWKAIGLIG